MLFDNNRLRNFFFVLFVGLTFSLIGCGSDGGGGGGGGDDSSTSIETQEASFAGRVTDEDGDPVKNAEITVQSTGVSGSSSQYAHLPTSDRASQYAQRRAQMASNGRSYQAASSPRISETLTTDDKGYFDLDGVELREGYQYVIRWDKNGFSGSTTRITFTGDDDISLGSLVARNATSNTVTNVDSDTATLADSTSTGGSASVNIPAGSLQQNGDSVSGDVSASITASDPTTDTGQEAFPGDYQAASAGSATSDTSLESVAYMDVDLTDENGDPIRNVNPDSPVTIYQSLPDRYSNLDTGAKVPWWSFDENQAVWVKEDAFPNDDSKEDAEVVMRDGEKMLKAKVTHFSSWNYDKPVPPPACYKVRVEDENGDALQGVTVRSRGVTYANRFSVNTDESGVAYVPVKRDKSEGDNKPLAVLSAKVGDKQFYIDDPGNNSLVDQENENNDIQITNYPSWSANPADTAPVLETPDQACASSASVRDLDQRDTKAFVLGPSIVQDTQVTVSGTVESNALEGPMTNFELNTLSGKSTVTDDSGSFELKVFPNSEITVFTGLGYSEDFSIGESDTSIGTINIPNQLPNISSLSEDSLDVTRGGAVSLSVDASDPEEQPLSYNWTITSSSSSDTGSLSKSDSSSTWNIPSDLSRLVNHQYNFSVQVDDGDSVATRGRTYTVPASLVSITADNTTVTPGTDVNLSAEFEVDGVDPCSLNELSCRWVEETSSGNVYDNFSDSTAASPTWTAPFLDQTRTLSLVVTDQNGNELQSNIGITVSPNEDLQTALTQLGEGRVAEATQNFDQARQQEPTNGQAQVGYAISALASSVVRNDGLRDFSTDVLQAYKGEVLVGGDTFTTDVTADSLPAKDILSDTTIWESDGETLATNFATSGSLAASFAESSIDLSSQLIAQAALDSSDAGYDTSITRLQDILVDLSEDTFTEASQALQTAIDNNATFEVQYKHTPDPYDHLRDNADENDVLISLEPHDLRVARSAIELLRATNQFIAAHDLEVEDLTQEHIKSVTGSAEPTLRETLDSFPDLGSYRDSSRLLSMKKRLLEASRQIKAVYNEEISRRTDSIDGNNTDIFDASDTIAELREERNFADTTVRLLDGTLTYADLLKGDENFSDFSNSMDIDLDGIEETLRTPSAFFDAPPSIRDLVYKQGVYGGPLYNFPSGSLSFLSNDSLDESRISTALNLLTLGSVNRTLPDTDNDDEPDSASTTISMRPFNIEYKAIPDNSGNDADTYTVEVTTSTDNFYQYFKNVSIYPIDTHVVSTFDRFEETNPTQSISRTWREESVEYSNNIDYDITDDQYDTAWTNTPPLVFGFKAEFTDTAVDNYFYSQGVGHDVNDTGPIKGIVRAQPYREADSVAGFTVNMGNAGLKVDIVGNREAQKNQFLDRQDLQFGNYKVYGVVLGDSQSSSPASGTLKEALNARYGSDVGYGRQISNFESEVRTGAATPEDFNLQDITTAVDSLNSSPTDYVGSFDVKTARDAITTDTTVSVGYVVYVPSGHYVYIKNKDDEGHIRERIMTAKFSDDSLLQRVSGVPEPERPNGVKNAFFGSEESAIKSDITIKP